MAYPHYGSRGVAFIHSLIHGRNHAVPALVDDLQSDQPARVRKWPSCRRKRPTPDTLGFFHGPLGGTFPVIPTEVSRAGPFMDGSAATAMAPVPAVRENGHKVPAVELYTRARAQFKYFAKRDLIFMENAGGSQVLHIP